MQINVSIHLTRQSKHWLKHLNVNSNQINKIRQPLMSHCSISIYGISLDSWLCWAMRWRQRAVFFASSSIRFHCTTNRYRAVRNLSKDQIGEVGLCSMGTKMGHFAISIDCFQHSKRLILKIVKWNFASAIINGSFAVRWNVGIVALLQCVMCVCVCGVWSLSLFSQWLYWW